MCLCPGNLHLSPDWKQRHGFLLSSQQPEGTAFSKALNKKKVNRERGPEGRM